MKAPSKLTWMIVAFCLSGALMTAILVWQLLETTPARWCVLANKGSPEFATGCIAILMRLLDIKDHVVIGLLVIVGLSVLSLAAVALGVRLQLSTPGGLSANIEGKE
jgi:peptidoglycan/LPS O-acetylase OafA/YrhL